MKRYTTLAIILLIGNFLFAQDDNGNLQLITPSVLIKPGHWEFKSFQNFILKLKASIIL